MQAVNNGTLLTSNQPSSNNGTTPYFPLQFNLPRNGVQNNGGSLGGSQAAALAAVASAAGLQTTMKDSRWLTLEVCRQNQRKMCSRDEKECKFAHPPPQVDVQNGRVTCCYDSIKGKCQRRDPPCKYFHPPQHLREQLLQNGRNNLIMKGMQLQFFQQQFLSQGAILPLNSATSTTSVNGSPPCPPQPGPPVSSASINSSSKFIYPTGPQLNLTAPNIASAYSLLLSQQMTQPSVSPMLEAATNPLDNYLVPLIAAVPTGTKPIPSASIDLCPMEPLQTGQKRTAACLTDVAQAPYFYSRLIPERQPINFLDPSQFTVMAGCAPFAGSISNPVTTQQQQQLGVNLSPYLNPITASQLNPMVAAALSAVKGGPVSNANAHTHISPLGPLCMMAMQPPVHSLAPFSLSSTLVAANGTATPAKRPALSDAKNGLPIFDSSQSAVTSTTSNNTGLYSFQSSSDTSGQKSILGADDVGENTTENDKGRQQQLQPQVPFQLQFYPETYMEVPQYGYP